jgi:RNA polymerase sigma-70 factor (sigma-E family)
VEGQHALAILCHHSTTHNAINSVWTLSDESPNPPLVRAKPDFRAFYRGEYRAVLGLAYALSGDMATAEDLSQEAFMAAFRRWEEVGAMDHPGAWVRRVVANKSVSLFRRVVAEGRALLRFRPDPVGPSPSVDSLAVWTAMRKLPRRQAEVIVLVYFSGLTHAEAAKVMGCSVETARTHLKRAKTQLAAWLRDDE